MTRNINVDQVDIILGIDAGQEFLKLSCSVIVKPEHRIDPSGKRLKYSDGYEAKKEFSDTSVKKTFILGILPFTVEGHYNLRSLLDKTGIPSFNYSMSEDCKVILDLLGKQCASCKHPCIYCEASSDFPEGVSYEHLTLASLQNYYEQYKESGFDKTHAMNFQNVINPPLITGDPDIPIFKLINIPGLHILLGIVLKLLVAIQSIMEDGIAKMDTFLDSNNIKRIKYQGQERLDGNQCAEFVRKDKELGEFLNSQKCSEDPVPYVQMVKELQIVMDGCFGKTLSFDYKNEIKQFCSSYRNLGLKPNLKFHILEVHIVEFLEYKDSRYGLGYWTEQALEAIHCDFKKFWLRRKVDTNNLKFSETLFKAVIAYNSSHM